MTGLTDGAPDTVLAQALNLHQQGAVAQAMALYRTLLETRPEDMQLLFLTGTAAFQLGDPSAAVSILQKVIAQVPDSAGARVNLALALQQLGETADALVHLTQAVKANPTYAEAWFCRANLLSALGRQSDALEDYTRAESFRHGYGECLYNHALLLASLERYGEAERKYDAAIAAVPDYAEAYNNRSVLRRLIKHLPEALADCDRALELNPTDVDAHINRGNILREMGRPDEALFCFSAALSCAANSALAYCSRADTLRDLGRVTEALTAYGDAISCDPGFVQARIGRGNLLMEQKAYAEALEDYDLAVRLQPELAAGWNNRGNALWKLKQLESAEASFSRALTLMPDSAESHNNRACVLKDMALFYQDGKLISYSDGAQRSNVAQNRALLEAALAACDSALAFRPDYCEAYLNRGHILAELNRPNEALQAYEEALDVDPAFAEAFCGKANLLAETGAYNDALAAYDRAIALKPDYGEAYNNRGNLLKLMRRIVPARTSLETALMLEPDNPSVRWNLALLELAVGNYPRGWELYESRWTREIFAKARRTFPVPQWTGAGDVRGLRLLLHAEQGFGDTVQFCRYIPLVAARGAQVIVEAPASLLPLLKSLDGVVMFVRRGDPLPDFDLHCPLMSLPRAFGTAVDNIPFPAGYLAADPALVGLWHQLLGPKRRPRVGLVVSGKPEHSNDRNRSIALQQFADVLALPFDFHLLQKDVRREDEAVLATAPALHDHRDRLQDFGDTAALISCMDCVISVDTSVAHVTGALGVPLHLLLPFAVDWRWFLEGGETPWYSHARLWRQPAQGDWKTPLMALMNHLRIWATG